MRQTEFGAFFRQFYVGVDLHFSGVVLPLRSVSFPVLLFCKLDPGSTNRAPNSPPRIFPGHRVHLLQKLIAIG